MSKELLDKYFKGQCSPEEKLVVNKFLQETKDLPEYLLDKNEWDEAQVANISVAKTEEMFAMVKKHTQPRFYKLGWMKRISAAALILAILSIGLWKLNQNARDFTPAKVQSQINQKAASIQWKSVVNYTEYNQEIKLPDSSTVKIYPGAELRYTLPFGKEKRELYLKGKSFFQVTKDKVHPFVVYANGISTTALGTSFTITAKEKGKFIKVQLHTGKVWVKNIDSAQQIMHFNKILLPGNELVYNLKLNKVKVSNSRIEIRQEYKIKELNFTQASLVDVFTRLEEHYKVKIKYRADDLKEMSFTGSLKLTTSVDTILEEIAELNKLKQTKTNDGYLISK
ncbi:FecR family protein [Pedobacter sp. HMWF019]|uniref:FecR family protein n=1 Tax=Pedobacter sp. HMWF019 TaxID=2056856 RepID=UPI00130487AA|nr:FecR family protein [Pedobacter sp. HMWF019]